MVFKKLLKIQKKKTNNLTENWARYIVRHTTEKREQLLLTL